MWNQRNGKTRQCNENKHQHTKGATGIGSNEVKDRSFQEEHPQADNEFMLVNSLIKKHRPGTWWLTPLIPGGQGERIA